MNETNYTTDFPDCLWHQRKSGLDLNVVLRVGKSSATREDFPANAGVLMARCMQLRHLLPYRQQQLELFSDTASVSTLGSSTNSLFSQNFKEKRSLHPVLEITDMEPDQFRPFLEYVYRDKMASFSNFYELLYALYAAKRFVLPPLIENCRIALADELQQRPAESVPYFIDRREEMELEKEEPALFKLAEGLVMPYAIDILQSQALLKVSKETLAYFMDQMPATVPPLERLAAINRWATAECHRQNLSPTQENKLSLCREICYRIRAQDVPTDLLLTRVRDMQLLPYDTLLDTSRYAYDKSIHIPFPCDKDLVPRPSGYELYETRASTDDLQDFKKEADEDIGLHFESLIYENMHKIDDSFSQHTEMFLDVDPQLLLANSMPIKSQSHWSPREPVTKWRVYVYPGGKTDKMKSWISAYLDCRKIHPDYEDKVAVRLVMLLECEERLILRRETNALMSKTVAVQGFPQFIKRDELPMEPCHLRVQISWKRVTAMPLLWAPLSQEMMVVKWVDDTGASQDEKMVRLNAEWTIRNLRNAPDIVGVDYESPLFGRDGIAWTITLSPNGAVQDYDPYTTTTICPLRCGVSLKHLPPGLRGRTVPRVAVQLVLGTGGRRTFVWKRDTTRDFLEQDTCGWQFGDRPEFQNLDAAADILHISAEIQYPYM